MRQHFHYNTFSSKNNKLLFQLFGGAFNFAEGTPDANFDSFVIALLTVFQVKYLFVVAISYLKVMTFWVSQHDLVTISKGMM